MSCKLRRYLLNAAGGAMRFEQLRLLGVISLTFGVASACAADDTAFFSNSDGGAAGPSVTGGVSSIGGNSATGGAGRGRGGRAGSGGAPLGVGGSRLETGGTSFSDREGTRL